MVKFFLLLVIFIVFLYFLSKICVTVSNKNNDNATQENSPCWTEDSENSKLQINGLPVLEVPPEKEEYPLRSEADSENEKVRIDRLAILGVPPERKKDATSAPSSETTTTIEEQIHQILLLYFSPSEEDAIIAAIKEHPIYEQMLIANQMKEIDVSRFHKIYNQYEKCGCVCAQQIVMGEILDIGICTYENAVERYRDTDYFGATNKYDYPKWQEDIDDYEQCLYCTYFLMQ